MPILPAALPPASRALRRGLCAAALVAAAGGTAQALSEDAAQQIDRIKYLAERQPQRAAEEIRKLERSGLTLSPRESLQLELGRAAVALGQVRTLESLDLSERAVSAASALGEPALLSEAHFSRGSAFYMLGKVPEAMADVERSLEFGARSGNVNLQIEAMVLAIYLHLGRGDLEKASFQLGQAQQLMRRGADRLRQARVAEAAAELANSLGEDQSAQAQYAQARAAYLEAENPLMASDMGRNVAYKLRRAERWAEALRVIDEVIVSATELQDDYGIGMAESGRAVALAALGRMSEALRSSDRSLALIKAAEGPEARLNVVLNRIELLTRYGKGVGVEAFLSEAQALKNAASTPENRMRHRDLVARALESLGRHREASAQLRELVKINDEWNAQRMSRGLAAQRGRIESQRLAHDNELLRREAEANARALEAARGQAHLRLILVVLLSLIGAVALIGLWRMYQRSRSMSNLAGTDALTGAMNRRSLEEVGGKAMARCRHDGRPFSVAMLDLDHFKRVNDEHGHAVGDRVLRAVVQEMKRHLRDADHLGRYGGEEFVVVLTDTREDAATAVAERLRLAIQKLPFQDSGSTVLVTLSGGLAEARADDADFGEVVGRADAALYAAKLAGRDRIVIQPPPVRVAAP